ncbi:hypothetical protein C8A00DRAFT_14546 [Chaetomidium leptoderma]|uniref:DNA (cytosine-5-)-methyltransferase n=1 Tax=Chaetomidium leptoderma TaxID=669021 RepID=A0AAN6VN97_9PEZI|nr:hypothetical protein C8A00DRAFT_14546 [Chaetomidium leptoderma]
MSLSTAWPIEGQDFLGGGLGVDMDSPAPLDGQSQEGETKGPALHHQLNDFDFWPFAETANQGDSGETAAQTPRPLSRGSTLSSTPAEFEVGRSKNVNVELPTSTLIHPKAQYEGFNPPMPPSKERDAVASLMEFVEARGTTTMDDFVEFELDSFSFYVNSVWYPFEMRPLQHMATRAGHDRLYFDGVLSIGGNQRYVQKIEVSELPIGNYGTSHATAQDQIWVRSRLNAKREVYYRLSKPSTEYARFFTPFTWLADLAKHAVDYSAAMINQGRQVELESFKAHFTQWLVGIHGGSREFRRWRRKHPSDDYRTSVSANIDFIWKEMNGVLGRKKALSLQLCRETIYFTQYKPAAFPPLPNIVQGREEAPPTIVTPYVKDCFGHMVIGKMLKAIRGEEASQPSGAGAQQQPNGAVEKSVAAPARIPSSKRSRSSEACFLPLDIIDQIKIGDTISTPRDDSSTDTKWRSMASKGATEDGKWFGLVQQVHISKGGIRSFDVSWFYRPVETPCCMMKYPWPNELFLSDHCTCEEGRHARVQEHDILAVHSIDWFGSPNGGSGEFFVRQTYAVETRRWITLQRSHMRCSHDRQKPDFRTGDTVLAMVSKSQPIAEPFEVVKLFKQSETMFVRLRRLLRRDQLDPRAHAAPNELVYTDQRVVTKPDAIIGKCLVRFFRSGESIPTPYDRGGTGNLFFITHHLRTQANGDEECVPLGDFPVSLRQGFDPSQQTFSKLRGMDLFCGSGNFGRGLEEGGAVEMHWANDIWDKAIHTYMANTPDSNTKPTKPFLGSVDDLLRQALEGKYTDNVPRPGEVDFISAGSPCPGFSLLTHDKTTLAQIKNQSLVASFASFVDFYRPKYGILENVSTIVQARHNRSEDVLSQLFCAIVGMGYQAQLILGDAWSHGTPQCRNRVFLYFAAPGLRLPEAPLLSHSHYPAVKTRGLGEMCNGEPFVRRSFQPTPFKYVSAAEGTADLPLIGDGKAEPATAAFPDHRVCTGITNRLRDQIAAIPTHPHGMSFAKAWRQGNGVMSLADRELFPPEGFRVTPISQGWRRVRPADVFQTVTTRSQPTDARAGTGLHWVEDRPLTVHEIRRAQGFPDQEVLLGKLADQWKLVGNSVARQMALAVGLAFREAWEGSCCEEEGGREVSQSVSVSVEAAEVEVEVEVGDEPRAPVSRASWPCGALGGRGERRKKGRTALRQSFQEQSSRNQPLPDIIDLTSKPDVPDNDDTPQEVIDLTSASRSTTPRGTGGGLIRTLVAAILDSKAQSKKKRSALEAQGPEAEELRRPAKAMRLEREELAPQSQQEDEAQPVRTGPTVVRLLSPEELGSDGLGPNDELE